MGRLYEKRDGVEVKIVETGEVFNSIQSCADYLGVNVTWLAKVVRGESGRCTCRGYHIVRTDGLYDTVDTTKTEHRGRPGIKIMIVETGETFGSLTECAEAIGGYSGKIYECLHGLNHRHTHRGYHFTFC